MSNATLVNFASGETSPKSRGRFDIKAFLSSCRKLKNFIAEVAGSIRYRPGFRKAAETKSGNPARLIPFMKNDVQAYELEFTAGVMRVFKDKKLQTLDRTTVTGITAADPAVITVTSTSDLANGDDVIITGLVEMPELNGRVLRLANNAGSTYELVDPVTGTDIDASGWDAETTGGTLVEVYQIASPYALETDLADIHFAQMRDTMYLCHYKYAERKLTVDAADAWTLTTFSLTNDPFGTDAITSNSWGGGPAGGTEVALAHIYFPGGTDIEYGSIFTISGAGANAAAYDGTECILREPADSFPIPNAVLQTTAGVDVLASAIVAGVETAIFTRGEHPIAPAFYESRLFYVGSDVRPNTIFGSRSPSSTTGITRYDDFTGGADDDHAVFFTLAPTNGVVDYIAWGMGTARHFLVGTFGGVFRVSGSGFDEPITPGSINVRQISSFGCKSVDPSRGTPGAYIQRGGTTVRVVRYEDTQDDYVSMDLCLNADQIPASPLEQVVVQTGRPNLLWVRREDGTLAGMTVHEDENIAGWHRQEIGGTDAKVLDISVMPRLSADELFWIVAERTVDGVTRRTVEYLADEPVYPDIEDFFTLSTAETANKTSFWRALWRKMEGFIHLDASGTYDGSDRGTNASATLTPASTAVATGVAFTASANVFLAGDVGLELWKKPDGTTGEGWGRATITAYVSATEVTCSITTAFDSTDAIAAGDWYFAAKTIRGLDHLEGEQVGIVSDGGVIKTGNETTGGTTVSEGAITLAAAAAVCHIGLPYKGLMQTQNLEMGGRTGPAQTKPRNIVEMGIRFLNSLGCQFGTNLYQMTDVDHDSNDIDTSLPDPLFSGIKKVTHFDNWEAQEEKKVVVMQETPLPCVVQFIDVEYETADEE